MSSLAAIILVVFLVMHAFELAVDFLNLRHSEAASLPLEMAELYPGDRHARAKEYLRAQTCFGFWQKNLSLGLFVAFWLLGGLGSLDAWAKSFALGPLGTGLFFWGAITVGQGIWGLPFRYYHTFVLEERFGFNRTSLKTFVADTLKGALLGVILGAPLLSAVLWFFGSAGSLAWALVWGLLVAVQLLLTWIAPVFIFPLFFTFTPLESGELRQRIEDFVRRVGFTVAGVFVIDGSRRSSKANAFFAGMGKAKRIALFDTLLKDSSVEETLAVLAHEVGHSKRGHIWKGFLLSSLSTGLLCFGLGLCLAWPSLYTAFFVEPSIYCGLFLATLLYGPVASIVGVVSSILSRKHEFEADAYAAETASATHLVNALKKLSDTNLSNPTPHPWKVFLDYSHPPLLQRIRALERFPSAKTAE